MNWAAATQSRIILKNKTTRTSHDRMCLKCKPNARFVIIVLSHIVHQQSMGATGWTGSTVNRPAWDDT